MNNNTVKNRIENLQTKIALKKLRKIILNEIKKGYYQNAANIHEFVDIDTHVVTKTDGSEYMHVFNVAIYRNGFYRFNRFDQTISGISYVSNNPHQLRYRAKVSKK